MCYIEEEVRIMPKRKIKKSSVFNPTLITYGALGISVFGLGVAMLLANTTTFTKSKALSGPIDVVPKSGNWNNPETFLLTNISQQSVVLYWVLDCWDETVCNDLSGHDTIAPGQTIEKGLGLICTKWQLDIKWTGPASGLGDDWDWGGVVEKATDCTNVPPTPTPTPGTNPTPTPEPLTC